MTNTATCPETPSLRLLENYRNCLQERLWLWFADDVDIVWNPGRTSSTLRRADWSACLEFLPHECRWRLESGGQCYEGSFDRVSKRLRQIFSGLP